MKNESTNYSGFPCDLNEKSSTSLKIRLPYSQNSTITDLLSYLVLAPSWRGLKQNICCTSKLQKNHFYCGCKKAPTFFGPRSIFLHISPKKIPLKLALKLAFTPSKSGYFDTFSPYFSEVTNFFDDLSKRLLTRLIPETNVSKD